MFVFSRAGPAQFYAKPNPNPNPNLSPSSARTVPVPAKATLVLTEMKVAAHAQTMPYLETLGL